LPGLIPSSLQTRTDRIPSSVVISAQPRKKELVRQMFSDISPLYDRLNRLMSLNLDQKWRRQAVQNLKTEKYIVDLCAGTGDMSLALLKNKEFAGGIVLVDINPDMLALAKEKLRRVGFVDRVTFLLAEVENLPFPDNTFDGAMQGFALRNLENLEKFFLETKRIIKASKSVCFLEIAHPENRVVQKLFYFYFYNLLPPLTSLITGNGTAYRWLPQSLREFPHQAEVVTKMREAGLKEASYQNIAGGMVACYRALK